MNRDDIAQIFDDCDQKNRGYIEVDDLLSKFANQLPADQLTLIFDKLDQDRDGRVYKRQFLTQFFSLQNSSGEIIDQSKSSTIIIDQSKSATIPADQSKSPTSAVTVGNFLHNLRRRSSAAEVVASLTSRNYSIPNDFGAKKDKNNNEEKTKKMMIRRSTNITESLYFRLSVEDLGADFALMSKEQQDIIFELYEDLQRLGVEIPLLNQFEKMIANFCREIKNYKDMSDKMFNIHQKEKELHAKQLFDIENDLEQQLILIKERIRKEEKEKFENEKESLRQEYETEMHDLREKMNYLQKIVDIRSNDDENSDAVSKTKAKIQDIKKENRILKSNLVEKNTELAIVRSYLVKLRREYEQKCLNLDLELMSTEDLDAEKRHYEKQMQILQDVNKVLYDANDNLLTTLESRGLLFPPQKNVRPSSPLPMPSDYASSDGESFASYRLPVSNQASTMQATRSMSNAPCGTGASCYGDTDDDVDSGVLSNKPTCSYCYSVVVETENDAVCSTCRCRNLHISTRKVSKAGKIAAPAQDPCKDEQVLKFKLLDSRIEEITVALCRQLFQE